MSLSPNHVRIPSSELRKLEQISRAIEEITDYGIFMTNREGTITKWNSGASQIFGFEEKDILGAKLYAFLPPQVRPNQSVDVALNKAVENGHYQTQDWRVKKDGNLFWACETYTVIHDVIGEVVGFSVVVRDLTDQKNAENSLAQMERAISEIKDYAIVILDVQGFILNWNDGAELIKGYSREEIIGENFRKFYLPKDRTLGKPEMLLEIATKNNRAQDEGWRVRQDGSSFWANVTITAIHDELGNVTGYCKITKDLSEKKKREDSLKQLKRAFDEIEEYAILTIDPQGFIQNWNRGAKKIKGYSDEEIIGENFRKFYLPSDIEAKKPEILLDRARKYKQAYDEGWRVKKDGTSFWAGVTITAVHDENGDILCFSKITRDLSSKRKNELKLEQLQRAVNKISDYAILIIDKQGFVMNWNAGAERIKGYRAEEIIGKNFRAFYSVADQNANKPTHLLKKASEQGYATDEGWRIRKDGSEFWAGVTITAIHNEEGVLTGYSKITRDLTERRRNELARAQDFKRIESKNEELQQFAYVASHDLKEPLNSLKVLLDLLGDDYYEKFDEINQANFVLMQEATDRMKTMITDLLDYGRLGADSKQKERVNCQKILSGVKQDLASAIERSGSQIRCKDLPELEAYKTDFRLLFQNLVSNAIKFSKPGQSPEVEIEAKQIATGWQFSVSDNGIGIPENKREDIFKIFNRLHNREQYEGTGVGLAHCKKVVEMHGGEIWVTTNSNDGSTFHFTISN